MAIEYKVPLVKQLFDRIENESNTFQPSDSVRRDVDNVVQNRTAMLPL